MKKFLIIFLPIIIIVCIIAINYYAYINKYNSINEENEEYEKYLDKEIYGLDLASLINKTVDTNTKNKIEKDENNCFIENDENSIEIEIYISDNETKYKMEAFYNAGTEQFVQYYGDIKFVCKEISYHEKTKKISYLYFEQVSQ